MPPVGKLENDTEKGRLGWASMKTDPEGVSIEIFGNSEKYVTELSLLRIDGAVIFIYQHLRVIPI